MSISSNVTPKNQIKGYGMSRTEWLCPGCGKQNKPYMASCGACKIKRPDRGLTA